MNTIITEPEFVAFPKIARLRRECAITEKIDGTNASIIVTEEGGVFAASRKRLITPQDDNYCFAQWVYANADRLREILGTGRHFGEWWGSGIQRRYGLGDKRFSLFNTARWGEIEGNGLVHVVPTLYTGEFNSALIANVLCELDLHGSVAAPGFMNPEGIVIFHKAAGTMFKMTIEKDDEWKGKSAQEAA